MQGYDRYAYVNNSPVRYNDPSGHCVEVEEGLCVHLGEKKNTYHISAPFRNRFNGDFEADAGAFIITGDPETLRYSAYGAGFMAGAAIENACNVLGKDCGNYYNIVFTALTAMTGALGGVGAGIHPTGSSGVPSNLTDDVYSSGGWVPGNEPNPWGGQFNDFALETETTVFRVWSDVDRKYGNWLSLFRPTTRLEAIRKLALPWANKATFITPVTLPAGTRIRIGAAGPMFRQPGGYPQVQVLGPVNKSWFGNDIPLPAGLFR